MAERAGRRVATVQIADINTASETTAATMSNIFSRLFNSSSDDLYWNLQLILSLLVGLTFVIGFWTVRVGSRANKRQAEELAKTNERAAKLEKEAEEARLELAKIDPVNLPIRSIRADIFLLVRGNFFESHFENNPVIKGGARSVIVSLDDKEGSLVDLEASSFESFVATTVPNTSDFDGRTFQMSFVWPAADWLTAKGVFKYWIDRTNASTAMLDKQMLGMLISLPPTKDVPEKPVEIIDSLCSITINGTIRRNFSVPKSAPFANIFCPVKKD